MQKRRDLIEEGQKAYQEWRDSLLANPEFRAVYEEEAAKKDLWLQLVEARQKAGLTQVELAKRLGVSQAQVARIEKRGYDAYTLNSLRRYVQALGEGFSLVIAVRQNTAESVTLNTDEQEETSKLVSIAQAAALAKEAWVAAETEVQNARTTAHNMATSISFLSQKGGLSNELMAELLRRQSDANQELVKAQTAARMAYEKFLQAQEEVERSREEIGNRSPKFLQSLLSASTEDNTTDPTTQVHAEHLY